MKINLLLVCILCFVFSIQAQNKNTYKITRSNMGSGGSSQKIATSKGNYIVSQSIGQSSVIGTSNKNGYYLRHGYQQPVSKIKVVDEVFKNNDLLATIYPNPFEESVSISFNEDMERDIDVLVFDLSGKLIFSNKYAPSKNIQLQLDNISSGSYLLKVLSNNRRFNVKLIKK
ncbi:T9SS type A sorting domain-containing protein [Litoribaculum gwangyangense]|uniref:T9SS type A sorting domain-containing protein n=1 Tax=Litoribaculum gwangyangense TaxID=1130722 RepID=A0ABP9CM31_9FLAO